MMQELYLGKKLKITVLETGETFEDYLHGHFVGSHWITSKGVEITENGDEAIPTRKYIPIRKS